MNFKCGHLYLANTKIYLGADHCVHTLQRKDFFMYLFRDGCRSSDRHYVLSKFGTCYVFEKQLSNEAVRHVPWI